MEIAIKEHNINIIRSEYTNKSSRDGITPKLIVNHISEGSKSSLISWFTSPNNKITSAHFAVMRDGSIYNFVDIKETAWANGLVQKERKYALSKIVSQNEHINPNLFSISIEHEGIYSQTQGKLTDAQLDATIFLHNYIINEVKEIYGYNIPVDIDHIIGHCMIDAKTRGNCPGQYFPYDEILDRLEINRSWAKNVVLECIEKGIITGYPNEHEYIDRLYEINTNITRAEVCSMFSNLIKYLNKS